MRDDGSKKYCGVVTIAIASYVEHYPMQSTVRGEFDDRQHVKMYIVGTAGDSLRPIGDYGSRE